MTEPQPHRLDIAYRAAMTAGRFYAEESLRTAFELLRQKIPAAAAVVTDKDASNTDGIEITLLAVRAANGDLLWYRDIYRDHPDAIRLGAQNADLDVDSDELVDITYHLRVACTQQGLPVFEWAHDDAYAGLAAPRNWELWTAAAPADALPLEPLAVVREQFERTVEYAFLLKVMEDRLREEANASGKDDNGEAQARQEAIEQTELALKVGIDLVRLLTDALEKR